jgi:hypothetical protein
MIPSNIHHHLRRQRTTPHLATLTPLLVLVLWWTPSMATALDCYRNNGMDLRVRFDFIFPTNNYKL